MNLVDQLVLMYITKETWHRDKLEHDLAHAYFTHLLNIGNIITVCVGDKLVGYCEFWRVNYQQWGRIVCDEKFSAMYEDVSHGQIAYLANIYIEEDHRDSKVIKMLRDRFFEVNKLCTHFVGEARAKRSGFIKVFKRSQLPVRI